jgi:hypothetical protein
MKISKLAVAALFVAGFITTGATAGMASDTPYGLLDCAEGYTAVYSEDGFSGSCAAIPDIETITTNEIVIDCKEGYTAEYSEDGSAGSCVAIPDIETIKPINSCWETEDGINVCARGYMPPVKTDVQITPYDAPAVCASPEDPTSAELADCKTPTLYDSTDISGEAPMPVDGEGMVNDPTLMYQSGVPMAASATDNSSSNTLAAFGVLVAALGALGIGISRQRAAK